MKSVTHLVFAAPRTPAFRQAMATATAGDRLVFAGHSVSAGTRADILAAIGELDGVHVGVLKPDLEDRGLLDLLAGEAIVVLDDAMFVDWVSRSELTRSWL